MEVVAHQRADRTMILPRDLRGPGENGGLVRRKPARRLDSCDDLLHLGDRIGREENRHVGEQVGLRADERLTERWVTGLALQRLVQRRPVERDAKAGLVEAVRDRLKPIGENGSRVFMDLSHTDLKPGF